MAGPTLCVSCALLPIKDREIATRVRRCSECKAELGVSSYGKPFRARPAKRGHLLTPSIFLSVCGAATALMVFAAALFIVMLVRTEPQRRVEKPMAAIKPIVPALPEQKDPVPVPMPGIDDGPVAFPEPGGFAAPAKQPPMPPAPPELLAVAEVALDDPIGRVNLRQATQDQRDLIGQIRRENAAKQDGFLLAQMDRRTELRGLPFIMGDDCKLTRGEGETFGTSVREVREMVDFQKHNFLGGLWGRAGWLGQGANLAALSQITPAADVDFRQGLAAALAGSDNRRAGVMLANSSISDPAESVRKAAITALKKRDKGEYTEVLLKGLRYPLPSVARNAADALIALDRKDLLPHLVDFLGEAGPGDPVAKKIDGKDVHVVREVVRINHHRNCLLCHAPVATANLSEVAALMPMPGQPFPRSSHEYYGNNITPESLAVRADITYLRQDFSVLLPVADAHPWPEMQRFDFLVRTRVVEGNELARLQKKLAERPLTYLSEQHKEALRALRELSGQDAVPIQAAWRRVLSLNN